MRTSELRPGEAYFAVFGYTQYQVVPIETTIWTKKHLKVSKTVTEMVDPPTPFDPQTGRRNPQVERTRTVYDYVTEFVPGSHHGRSGSYSWSDKNEVGIPCFVRYAYSAKRGQEDWQPEIVRPATIKSTWKEYVDGEAEAQAAEQRRKAARIEHDTEVIRLNRRVAKVLGFDEDKKYVNTDQWGTAVSMNVRTLQFLLDVAEAE